MKRYGIKITMPPGHTFTLNHLLGDDFVRYRWYDTAKERDEALEAMRNPPPYYREGDQLRLVYTKVERSSEDAEAIQES
jgi:hypothetical protein